MDKDDVRTHVDDHAGHDGAGLELGELFTLLEEFGKTFSHEVDFR